MRTYGVALQGYLVKRVGAPSREALEHFLAAQALKRWLASEPHELSHHSEPTCVDAVLDDLGNIIRTTHSYNSAAPAFTLVRAWQEAICLAAIQRAPNQAAVVLAALIDLIDATGGLTTDDGGAAVPVAAGDWPDLAEVYRDACKLVQIRPMQPEEDDDA